MYLGQGFRINKDLWQDKIRTAPSDSKFNKSLATGLWTPQALKERTVAGMSKAHPEKKKATPKKVDAVMRKFLDSST